MATCGKPTASFMAQLLEVLKFLGVKKAVICVDRDPAGEALAVDLDLAIGALPTKRSAPPKPTKDWAECLNLIVYGQYFN